MAETSGDGDRVDAAGWALGKRSTACHEAGHAVAHIRLGIEQGEATIVPKTVPGGRRVGAVSAEGVQHVWGKEQAGPMVLAFGAGYAALVAAGRQV